MKIAVLRKGRANLALIWAAAHAMHEKDILLNQENLKDIAEALLDLKYDVIAINIIAVFIAIIAVYLFTRLKKSAELKEINNNFSTVKKQQTELSEATGSIKQAIEQKNIHYQIKLHAYHEKSIKAINDIYVAIIELREKAKNLGINLNDEEKKKFYNKIYEFRSIFDINKIWIPADLSQHIEIVAKEIEKRSTRFIIANKQEGQLHRLSAEKIEKINDELDKFYDYIHKEIDLIFDDLVEKITKKVGT